MTDDVKPATGVPRYRLWDGEMEQHDLGDFVPTEDAAAVIDRHLAARRADAARIARLEDALRDVRRRITESEEWWMDNPHRGGFDVDLIESALAVGDD